MQSSHRSSSASISGPFKVSWAGNAYATKYDVSYAVKTKTASGAWAVTAWTPWLTQTTAKSAYFGLSGRADRRKAAADQAYNHLEGRPVEKNVKVRVENDGFLVVLHADPDGRVRMLFPLDPDDDHYPVQDEDIAALQANMRSQAPWLSFVPTFYYRIDGGFIGDTVARSELVLVAQGGTTRTGSRRLDGSRRSQRRPLTETGCLWDSGQPE